MKFKKDDPVLITAGKDKGRQGKILKIYPQKQQVLVEGINKFVRHLKARMGQNAERVERFRPMEVSKIALVCPKCKKPTRVGYEVGIKTKEKVRVCRKCGENIKN